MAVPSPMPCKAGERSTERTDGLKADGVQLITTDPELDACVASLGDVVGLDTEFIRVRTFYPIPALYQLAGDAGVALVDGQVPAEFASLKALLLDPSRTKIVHACSEDLEVIARHFGLRPVGLVDTQVAHAFLGLDFTSSYAKLVEHYLGLRLGKQETRSDWLRRPLSRDQIAYAREDVAYLRPIWQRQRQALVAKGRLDWFIEEMARILATPVATPDSWFETLKGAWRLSRRERGVLRSLVRWRENEARRRDLPRAYTVRDEHLLVMARYERLEAADVARLLPRRAANRYGSALARVHLEGLEDPTPPPEGMRPLNRRDAEVVKEMRTAGRREAERLGIAPELLTRKRDLEADFRQHRDSGELPVRYQSGWRRNIVGGMFGEILRGTVS